MNRRTQESIATFVLRLMALAGAGLIVFSLVREILS